MRKINKILSLILLPLFALSFFTACEKDKSVENITSLFQEYKTDYPNLFRNVGGDRIDEVYITYEGEMAKIGDPSQLNAVGDDKLKQRYYAIKNAQDVVLKSIFDYYTSYSEYFYDNIELLKVEQDEINELFYRFEGFRDALNRFETARAKAQSDINVHTFGGALRSSLTQYSYEYNALIESSLYCINYFKELNIKYVFSGNFTDGKESYYQHFIREFNYNNAVTYYYLNLKALNDTNECDLSVLNIGEESPITILSSVVNDGNRRNLEYISDTSIELLLEARRSFLQKYRIVFSLCGSMNMYGYRMAKIEGNLGGYRLSVGSVERANIDLIESFATSTYVDYVVEMSGLYCTVNPPA